MKREHTITYEFISQICRNLVDCFYRKCEWKRIARIAVIFSFCVQIQEFWS